MADITSFVREQLSTLSPSYGLTFKGGNAWVRCPTHSNGNEHTPSRIINLADSGKMSIGYSSCFGCGKNMDWNGISVHLKLKAITGSVLAKQEASVGLSNVEWDELMNDGEGHNLYFLRDSIPWPKGDEWRTIKGSLLARLKCKMYYDPKMDNTSLFIPVSMFGDDIGGIKARIKKRKGSLSYVNLTGAWSAKALFPYDYVKGMIERKDLDYVVLVEGPRDALWLIQHGIPALAFLGSSQAWSKTKEDAIVSLDIETVVMAFDGDDAGRSVTKLVRRDLKSKVTNLVRLKMEEGSDPASLSPKKLRKLKNAFKD